MCTELFKLQNGTKQDVYHKTFLQSKWVTPNKISLTGLLDKKRTTELQKMVGYAWNFRSPISPGLFSPYVSAYTAVRTAVRNVHIPPKNCSNFRTHFFFRRDGLTSRDAHQRHLLHR